MWLLRTKAVRIGIVVGSIVACIGLAVSTIDLWGRRGIVAEREKVLARVEAENKRLKDANQEAQTPQFVEKQAREKLGMVKEGETVVLMDEGGQGIGYRVQGKQETLPNWKQWARLFF